MWKEVGTRSDYEQEIGEKPLGEFVREIVGLDMNAAKEAPFTDQGSVVEIFKDITVWIGIKRVIDSINANAAA